jgi:outer membrane protein
MKKITFTLTILLVSSFFATAQVEKGKWFMAGYGQMNFDIGKDKTKAGSTISENDKYFEFNFNPLMGYFVIEKMPVGLFLDSYFDKYKTDNYESKYSQFIIGPFVRYYVLQLDKLFPYAEGRVGIGQYKSKYSDNDTQVETYSSAALGIGASYFFTNHLALDGVLGYRHYGWSYDSEDGGGVKSTASSTKNKYIDNGFMFRLGVTITFGKE